MSPNGEGHRALPSRSRSRPAAQGVAGIEPSQQNVSISETPVSSFSDVSALNAPFRLPAAPVETDLLAKYFRVLGDPTRLRILELLAGDERSVGELAAQLGEPQPKVSNHLACLRWCGFTATRREHRTVYYRVADERVQTVIALGRELLHDNEEHVAACERVDRSG